MIVTPSQPSHPHAVWSLTRQDFPRDGLDCRESDSLDTDRHDHLLGSRLDE